MDIKNYISSGVIETYVLGLATEAEARELERLSGEHPEVRAALDEAHSALETYALANAVPPPAGAKEKIWHAIESGNDQPVATTTPKAEDKQADKKIITDTEEETVAAPFKMVRSLRIYRFAAAASVALLIGGIAYHTIITNGYKQQLADMQDKQALMFAQTNDTRKLIEQYQHDVNTMSDPAMIKVALMGTPAHANMKAMVYWDSTSKNVFLALNNLPKPPAGKQYQLWAIVDGKPVDAGVYNSGAPELQKMRTIERAEMFAITLEKEGGSLLPTLDEMYVAGKI